MTTKSSNLFIKQGNNTKRFAPVAVSRSAGFTIVELLIVVIVIAILATLAIVGFNNINARATESALKSELQSAAKLVETDLINSGAYPADAAAANGGKGLAAGGKRVLSYNRTGTGYCASIHPEGNPDLTFRIQSGVGRVEPGVCESAEVMVSTLAGSDYGFADGTGAAAQFSNPSGVAVDASGMVYVADQANNRIRKITPAGVVSTLAGSSYGFANGTGTAAQFADPLSVAVDAAGMVYVADSGNNRIRKITPAGVVSTLAGSGYGFANGTGTAAQFANPFGVAVDATGTVYVADMYNHRIRKITPAGVVSTLAGSGVDGFANGTGTAAQFAFPRGVAVDAAGTVYVADGNNNRIRKITQP